jgi:DNA (cytosine-5)-methyltransferase 1
MAIMTVGSLFSGIGGFDFGLERSGMQISWQVEKNPFCLKVLTKHWPHVPKEEDIYNVDPQRLPPVDLICGGWPCQPFSVAGKQRGKEDDRYLWPEMLRIIEGVRPTWVIGENVSGFIRLGLDTALSDLETLGYSCRTFVIPACAVGAPHRRDRVWIVAYSDCGQHKRISETLAREEKTKKSRKTQPWGPTSDIRGSCSNVPTPPSNLRRASGDERSEPFDRGGDVSDAESSRQRHRTMGIKRDGGKFYLQPDVEFKRITRARRDKPSSQRGLGGASNGLSEGLDGPWDGDWEAGTPRAIKGQPDRVERLRALGNAIVPQIAEILGRAIIKFEESKE